MQQGKLKLKKTKNNEIKKMKTVTVCTKKGR